MDNIISTIAIAFVFISLAIAALSIGWLFSGKSRIKGSCGGNLEKKIDDSCDNKCALCQRTTDPDADKKASDDCRKSH